MRNCLGGKRETPLFLSFSVVVKSVSVLFVTANIGRFRWLRSANNYFNVCIISSRLSDVKR